MCLLVFLLSLSTFVGAKADDVESTPFPANANPPGTHYIVLLDDSGDMGRHRNRLRSVVPNLLFDGQVGGQRMPDFPIYDSSADRVSFVTFASYRTPPGNNCQKDFKKLSVAPPHMFQVEATAASQETGQLRSSLSGIVNKECRFGGYLSPIATSKMLVLQHLNDLLPDDAVYERTVLVVATNLAYNLQVSPSNELANFQRTWDVRDVDEASRTAAEVSQLFYLEEPDGWRKEYRGLWLLASEVDPLVPPDVTLGYSQSVPLDRQAVSSEALRVAPDEEQLGMLEITQPPSSAAYGFEPLAVQMGFQDEDGSAWQVGTQTAPQDTVISLRECTPPQCKQDQRTTSFSLFEAGLSTFRLEPSDPLPGPGQLQFRVAFRYRNDIYDKVSVQSDEQEIVLQPSPPREISSFLGLPWTGYVLDNAALASEYEEDEDGITTQAEAASRIKGRRTIWMWGLLASVIATLLYLTRYYYDRPFRPTLRWKEGGDATVDFNRTGSSRLLLGTFQVVNDQGLPWFGQLLGNDKEPSRSAFLSLQSSDFEEKGFQVTSPGAEEPPVGFQVALEEAQAAGEEADAVPNGQSSDELPPLQLEIEGTIAHGKQIHTFLATDVLDDFTSRNGVESTEMSLDLEVDVQWEPHDSSEPDEAEMAVDVPLRVSPEEARRPSITYEPNDERIEFREGENVEIGRFVLKSNAQHTFAEPFVSEAFTLEAFDEESVAFLPAGKIRLAQDRIEVPPKETVSIPVLISCDGETITNPDPVKHTYTFRLKGDYKQEFDEDELRVDLYRDSTQAEAEIEVDFPDLELYWEDDRLQGKGGTGERGATPYEIDAAAEEVHLDPYPLRFNTGTVTQEHIVVLRIGNTGRSGRGVVEAQLDANLAFPNGKSAKRRLKPRDAYSLADLMTMQVGAASSSRPGSVEVYEGDDPATCTLFFHPERIRQIDGARVPADDLEVRLTVDVTVTDDQGNTRRREPFTIVRPVELEQLPGSNWLCVDFGTSAISVARGTGNPEELELLPLQEIGDRRSMSFETFDPDNSEAENRSLLPSWVLCDADLREENVVDIFDRVKDREGFPRSRPSLVPGQPNFVSLPADDASLTKRPERVIYSLKSWLGKGGGEIRLQEPIKYRTRRGQEIESSKIPLRDTLRSGLAALSHAYIDHAEADYSTEQAVFTHPNSFTDYHRDALHDIAFEAFGNLDIQLRNRIRLVSESDAVAYYYCDRWASRTPHEDEERILVYDFGAGTLDLSLIRVTWRHSAQRWIPATWEVEGRIGVPVAGNHIDERLARLVDQKLEDLTEESRYFEYRRSLVGSKLPNDAERSDYRGAVLDFWRSLLETKHQWEGSGPFDVKVGTGRGDEGIVVSQDRQGAPISPVEGGASLWRDEKDDDLYLRLPAQDVNCALEDFVDFVTRDVIDELLKSTGIQKGDVDHVVVSGRGVLWADGKIRRRVWEFFPDETETPDFSPSEMKEAVVRGAVARQDLSDLQTKRNVERAGQYAVLINHGRDIIPESDWDEPLPLEGSPTFRIVQVCANDPNPEEDMGTLREHLYVDVAGAEYQRDVYWEPGSDVYLRKKRDSEGRLRLQMEVYKNGRRKRQVPIEPDAEDAAAVTQPPWPIGSLLLPPKSEE